MIAGLPGSQSDLVIRLGPPDRANAAHMGSVLQLHFASAPKNWISESGHLRSLYAKFTILVAAARADSDSGTCGLRGRWGVIRLRREHPVHNGPDAGLATPYAQYFQCHAFLGGSN